MKKINLKRIAFYSILCSLTLSRPSYAEEEKTYFGNTEEEWLEKGKKYGTALYDWCSKVDEKINDAVVDPLKEKTSEIPFYKEDSLWLITDIPNKDPEEERHYYFIDKNTPSITSTTSYDKWGKKVDNDSIEAVKREQKEMYVSLTNYEEVFLIRYVMDLERGTYEVNYEDFSFDKMYEEVETLDYGRFVDVKSFIPEDLRKEKYSTKDLKEILDILNDKNYEITKKNNSPLERKR